MTTIREHTTFTRETPASQMLNVLHGPADHHAVPTAPNAFKAVGLNQIPHGRSYHNQSGGSSD